MQIVVNHDSSAMAQMYAESIAQESSLTRMVNEICQLINLSSQRHGTYRVPYNIHKLLYKSLSDFDVLLCVA